MPPAVLSTQSDPADKRRDFSWLLAGAAVLFLLWTNRGYGFHRDELATLDDARHLAWGFVAYPPITPFFGWISLHLFGTWLPGFRLFASIAAALVAVLTAATVREFGGGRTPQILAAAATLPFSLATGSLMQYVAFDYLWWVLTFYCFIRLLKSNNPRWWLGVGASIGLGMLTNTACSFASPVFWSHSHLPVAGETCGRLGCGLARASPFSSFCRTYFGRHHINSSRWNFCSTFTRAMFESAGQRIFCLTN